MNANRGIVREINLKGKLEVELFSPSSIFFPCCALVFACWFLLVAFYFLLAVARYLLLSTQCFLLFAHCLLAILSSFTFLEVTSNYFCPSLFF